MYPQPIHSAAKNERKRGTKKNFIIFKMVQPCQIHIYVNGYISIVDKINSTLPLVAAGRCCCGGLCMNESSIIIVR